MPKKGIVLSPHSIQLVKAYLAQQDMSQERFAEELKVTTKTLNNWLTGKNAVDVKKLNLIIEKMGVGLTHFFDSNELPPEYQSPKNALPTIREMLNFSLVAITEVYKAVERYFKEQISFSRIPETGYFRKFGHNAKVKKNYYYEVWIQLETETEEAKFLISFTFENIIRITYGEIIIKADYIEIIQYFQEPNLRVNRPDKSECSLKIATWLDHRSHTFFLNSDVPFKLEEKSEIAEKHWREAQDIAVFPKHFWFHK